MTGDDRPLDLPYDALEWPHEPYRGWGDRDARRVD